MPSKANIVSTYALLVFIWATTPLAIVWSVSDLHLFWALVLRFFIALPLAIMLLLILKVKFPTDQISWHSYLAGSFSLMGSQIFTYIATSYLSSGIIALMFGLAPIMAGLIGYFGFKQRLSRLQWLGMVIAGANIPIVEWSTLGGLTVTTSQELAMSVFQAVATLDATLFAHATELIAQVDASDNPTAVDITIGWPDTFVAG